LAHVARVTTAAFGNGTSSRLKDLNLQQKAVLCSLTALEQKTRRTAVVSTPPTTPSKKSRSVLALNKGTVVAQPIAAPTIRALYDAYAILCSRDNVMHALSNTEFRDVVGTLESLSLITAVNGKTGSFGANTPSTPSKRGRNGFGNACAADQKRVSSCVGLQELDTAMEGVGSGILRSILSGEGF
jgi:cell division control protein 6